MPANPSTTEMGRRHIERVANALGITPSAASGSKWQNPADGRSAHDLPYPIAVEGKSTRGKSLTITLDMIAKLREQSLGETPVLPLLWYGTDDLTEVTEDWAAVPLDFLAELLASARSWVILEQEVAGADPDWAQLAAEEGTRVAVRDMARQARAAEALRRELSDAHKALLAAEEELDTLRGQAESQSQVIATQAVQHVPMLPWALIRMLPKAPGIGSAGDDSATVTAYAADGTLSTYRAKEVRVEHSADGHPKIFVDNVQVRDADLHDAEGKHLVRACRSDPSIEVG